MPAQGLAHEKAAAQVHGQHAVEGGGVLRHGGAGLVADAGIVDQTIEPAEAGQRGLHGGFNGLGLGHVAGQAQVLGAEFGGALRGAGAVQVEQGHGPALGGQGLGAGPADALGGAGDQRHRACGDRRPGGGGL